MIAFGKVNFRYFTRGRNKKLEEGRTEKEKVPPNMLNKREGGETRELSFVGLIRKISNFL